MFSCTKQHVAYVIEMVSAVLPRKDMWLTLLRTVFCGERLSNGDGGKPCHLVCRIAATKREVLVRLFSGRTFRLTNRRGQQVVEGSDRRDFVRRPRRKG